jgi:hypothetical protein
MKQSVVKVEGGEYNLERVIEYMLSNNISIQDICVAGGGFMNGSPVCYITATGDCSEIQAYFYNYVPKYKVYDLKRKLETGNIDKKKYEEAIKEETTRIYVDVLKGEYEN